MKLSTRIFAIVIAIFVFAGIGCRKECPDTESGIYKGTVISVNGNIVRFNDRESLEFENNIPALTKGAEYEFSYRKEWRSVSEKSNFCKAHFILEKITQNGQELAIPK